LKSQFGSVTHSLSVSLKAHRFKFDRVRLTLDVQFSKGNRCCRLVNGDFYNISQMLISLQQVIFSCFSHPLHRRHRESSRFRAAKANLPQMPA
jgi:hypothetical protein